MRDCYASAIPCLIEASGAEVDISLLDAVAHLPLALGYSRLLAATDALRFQQVLALSHQRWLPITACGVILIHNKSHQPLQDVVTVVRHRTTVNELDELAEQNAERVLRTVNALSHLYPVELLIESAQIADTCPVTLDEVRYDYFEEVIPEGNTPTKYLRERTYLGPEHRYGNAFQRK